MRAVERGGTLVELAVALGLGGVVLAALMLSFSALSRAEAESGRLSEVQRDVAVALQRATDAADRAGLCLQPGEAALQATQTAMVVYWRDVPPGSLACPGGPPSWTVLELVQAGPDAGRVRETVVDAATTAVTTRHVTSEATLVTALTFTQPAASCPDCVRVCVTARPRASGGREIGAWTTCTTVRPPNGGP